MLVLRPYQSGMITQARRHFKAGRKRVLLQLATGGGKTAMTSTMVHTAVGRGNRAWFVVHRRELVNQVCRAFDKEGIEYGVIASDYPVNTKPKAQVVSVQTVIRRLARLEPPELIVYDEAHHCASAMWRELAAFCKDSYAIGLTATPRRLDGAGLGKLFDEMVCGPSMKSLIADGFLAPYELYAPGTVNMDGVGVVGGEFNKREATARVTDAKIVGDAVAHYRKHCDRKRAVGFCVSVDHAKQCAEKFQQAGIPSTYFEGGTDNGLRDQITRDFETGHIKALFNCELLGEGYDLPAIEAAILLRPTMSLTLYLQQCGRALRFVEGKTAILLDHVGNSARHGYPDDERTWSLEVGGARKNSDGTRASPRVCSKCFASSRPTATVCSTCGHAFPSEAREIETEAGDLVLATKTEKQLQREEDLKTQGHAHSLAELLELYKMRHGTDPKDPQKGERWAEYILKSREKKRGAQSRRADSAG